MDTAQYLLLELRVTGREAGKYSQMWLISAGAQRRKPHKSKAVTIKRTFVCTDPVSKERGPLPQGEKASRHQYQ